MKFKDLELSRKLLRGLEDQGYETPTEIQEKTIKGFTEGKHIVGQSQTGSGKTAAFVLPLLDAIDTAKRAPQVLILAPTRELAAQIRQEVLDLSKYMNMRSLSAVGGTSKRKQIQILRKGPQMVIGTPGRVQDLIDSKKLKLDNIEYFVLDEVDRMLDMGFINDIRNVWKSIPNLKQALTFSATMPQEAKHLIKEFIGDDYTFIQISEELIVDQVEHMFVKVEKDNKYHYLKHMLESNPKHKVLVFAETKKRVDMLADLLKRDGFSVDALHGDMDQRERFRTLKHMREDNCRVLIATDVAARGLNMNDVHLVINYEVPNDPESYVHRIGRTARAGKTGAALMFVGNHEWDALHHVEKTNNLKIQQIDQEGQPVERTDKRGRRRNSRKRYDKWGKKGGKNKSNNRRRGSNRGSRGRRKSGGRR